MSIPIRVLDIFGLNLKLDIPENMTVAQLSNLLNTSYNVKTTRCSFSSNGKLLEPNTVLNKSVLDPSNSLTIFNDATFPTKSFPRVENSYPNQDKKFESLYQEQPKYIESRSKGRGNQSVRERLVSQFRNLIANGQRDGENYEAILNSLGTLMNFFPSPEEMGEDGFEDEMDNEEVSDDDENYSYDDEYDNNPPGFFENFDGRQDPEVIELPPNVFIDTQMMQQMEQFAPMEQEYFENEEPQDFIPPEIQEMEENFTEQQREVINRLCNQTGVDSLTVMQIYEACDRNEDLAINCLMSME